MKKWITWVLIITVVAGGGYFAWRYRQFRMVRAALQEAAGNLSTAAVERRDLDIIVTGKGTVQANAKKNVQPGVSGTVSRVAVDEGDLVSPGATLLVLSNDSVEYQADQARLDLALAEQELLNLTGPAGSRAKAELGLREAELDLTSAQDDVDGLTIKSPIKGDLWSVAVKEGDSVKAGQVVATVADTSSFTVDANVRQADLRKLTLGHKVSIMPGGDMKTVYGYIETIGSEGTSGSKGIEFPVEISIPDAGPDLRAGMTVQVDVHLRNGGLVSMTGRVEPNDRRDVEATVDGTVLDIAASEGLWVEKDQLILTLESNSVMVAYDQAKNAVESAKQTLATCQNDIDEQRLKVEQARITADDKAKMAAKLTVRSPIDGKVVAISAEAGDDVTDNETVVQVAAVAPLTVVIPVDELDVANVSVGQPAKVEVDAFPGQLFEGTVSKIAQEGAVQQGITNYDVTIEIQSDAVMLGMSATATISVASKAGVLAVPIEAITWEQDQAYVYKVANGQPVQARVKVGVQSDLYAEIASGLAEGDTVIVGGLPTGGGDLSGFRMFAPQGSGMQVRPR